MKPLKPLPPHRLYRRHRRHLSAAARLVVADRATQAIIGLFFCASTWIGYLGTDGGHERFSMSLVQQGIGAKFGRMSQPYGMAPWQFDSYIRACKKAGVSPQRVLQTIGDAPASVGFHAQDGIAHELNEAGEMDEYDYSAATDIRTRDLTAPQIKTLVAALTDAGFAPWYRYRGTFARNQHIHMDFVGYPMKVQLKRQVRDFLNDRTGMAGHGVETFYRASAGQKYRLRLMFLKRNPK